MQRDDLRLLLERVRNGELSPDAAMTRLATLPFESLDFARIDHHRGLRCGFAEVIFGAHKTDEQVAQIFERLAARGANVLATRVTASAAARIQSAFPDARFEEPARAVSLVRQAPATSARSVAIVSGGTSDIPVCEEARVTLEVFGYASRTLYDCGVAGVHRLLAHVEEIRAADVVIAVAGMEGALPSVVGGLVDVPVIAVPTSVGYGAHFQGLAPLLTMLNTCAAGVTVVNIDNGFGAAYAAANILRLLDRAARPESKAASQ